nr:SH2B adapter protein 2-like isoform X2 [Oncorhynchus nerka]
MVPRYTVSSVSCAAGVGGRSPEPRPLCDSPERNAAGRIRPYIQLPGQSQAPASQGQCHVHHLWFQSVGDMRSTSTAIPSPWSPAGLQTSCCDATSRDTAATQSSERLGSPPIPESLAVGTASTNRHTYFPELCRWMTHLWTLPPSSPALPRIPPPFPRLEDGSGGGLRSRSGSTEHLLPRSGGSADEQQESEGTQRTRAVENQYSVY